MVLKHHPLNDVQIIKNDIMRILNCKGENRKQRTLDNKYELIQKKGFGYVET